MTAGSAAWSVAVTPSAWMRQCGDGISRAGCTRPGRQMPQRLWQQGAGTARGWPWLVFGSAKVGGVLGCPQRQQLRHVGLGRQCAGGLSPDYEPRAAAATQQKGSNEVAAGGCKRRPLLFSRFSPVFLLA